jgi:hypothetical protein
MFTVHASTICSCVSIEYVNLHCQQKYRQLYLLVINCILGWRCKSTWVSKFSWEGNVCVERRIGFQHLFESSIWNAAQQLAPRKFVITTSWKLTVPSNTSHLTHQRHHTYPITTIQWKKKQKKEWQHANKLVKFMKFNCHCESLLLYWDNFLKPAFIVIIGGQRWPNIVIICNPWVLYHQCTLKNAVRPPQAI